MKGGSKEERKEVRIAEVEVSRGINP